MHGMPPQIAQLVARHCDIGVTLGYKAVYPEEVINAHRAFITRRRALRPAEEYRTPTDEERAEFLGHFERRKLSLGTCGRSCATSCIHEHACFPEALDHPRGSPRARFAGTAADQGKRFLLWVSGLSWLYPGYQRCIKPGETSLRMASAR